MLKYFALIFVSYPLILRFRASPSHRVFKRIAEFISLIPGKLGLAVRSGFYSKTLRYCGQNTEFGFGTILNYPDISIGRDVSFGRYCDIGLVDFGDFTLVASHCQFLSGNKIHTFKDVRTPIRQQPISRSRISVGSDVWVGSGALVMASVGSGAVVGAGSVVTRPIEGMQIVAGNPARFIRSRTESR